MQPDEKIWKIEVNIINSINRIHWDYSNSINYNSTHYSHSIDHFKMAVKFLKILPFIFSGIFEEWNLFKNTFNTLINDNLYIAN